LSSERIRFPCHNALPGFAAPRERLHGDDPDRGGYPIILQSFQKAARESGGLGATAFVSTGLRMASRLSLPMSLRTTRRALFFDKDGIVIDSQRAKTAGWLLAALHLLEKVPRQLIDELSDPADPGRAVNRALLFLQERFPREERAIAALAGLSRPDTRTHVSKFVTGAGGGGSEDDLDRLRNRIKDALILNSSTVIPGTLTLIRAAHDAGIPIALVTQAAGADVAAEARVLGIPVELFDAIECAGDYEPSGDVDNKRRAFQNACRRLACDCADGIALEDSDSGIASAASAGLRVIALRRRGNRQALKTAAVVLPDLGLLSARAMLDRIKSEPLDRVFHDLRRTVASPAVVASVVGGTRLTTAEVTAAGDRAPALDCAWAAAIDGDPGEGLTRLVAAHVERLAASRFVDVGVSLKGPLRHEDGSAWVGPWTVPPYTSGPWPFEERLRDALDAAGVSFGRTTVVADSLAALRGELSDRGTLAGLASGVVIVWGTGIGCAVQEQGRPVLDIGQNEPGDDMLRLCSSMGRHVVLTRMGWQYLPIPRGQTKAPLQPGDSWMSERLAGAWLPRRVAEELLRAGQDTRRDALRDMGAAHLDLPRYIDRTDERSDVEGGSILLGGLTQAAITGNEWARTTLGWIGVEFGAALAAFVWQFRTYEAVGHIVLASTIGEKLGRNAVAEGGGEDILMDGLRRSLSEELGARGMDAERARAIASGVRRSRIGRERELLAFRELIS
jgi:beta-phosphoglucomutase-like phosphatase (HAD superfamily)